MATDYTHEIPGEEIDSIAGHYVVEKELQLELDGRRALVAIGWMIVDTSCCGTGGCGFALVPGYLKRLHYRSSDNGRPVSEVEPIERPSEREKLSALIKKSEFVQQIRFL